MRQIQQAKREDVLKKTIPQDASLVISKINILICYLICHLMLILRVHTDAHNDFGHGLK